MKQNGFKYELLYMANCVTLVIHVWSFGCITCINMCYMYKTCVLHMYMLHMYYTYIPTYAKYVC